MAAPEEKGTRPYSHKKPCAAPVMPAPGVEEFVLRDLKISPCLEIYACKKKGECAIKDDFQMLRDKMLAAKGLIISSPIFFYSVSAHTKILMDRFQSLWVRKYWIDQLPHETREYKRKTLFISVGATHGKMLFKGVRLSMKYFLDTLDAALWQTLTYRGIDLEGEVREHPQYLKEAYSSGKELAEGLI